MSNSFWSGTKKTTKKTNPKKKTKKTKKKTTHPNQPKPPTNTNHKEGHALLKKKRITKGRVFEIGDQMETWEIPFWGNVLAVGEYTLKEARR